MVKNIIFFVLLMSSTLAFADPKDYKHCVSAASIEFQLPEELINGILTIENGRVGTRSKNKNGSYDLGPMQINTLWLKKFKPYGITKNTLIWDACTNIRVGSWILKQEILTAKGDFWRGVGNYHSRTPFYHNRYLNKLVKIIKRNRENS